MDQAALTIEMDNSFERVYTLSSFKKTFVEGGRGIHEISHYARRALHRIFSLCPSRIHVPPPRAKNFPKDNEKYISAVISLIDFSAFFLRFEYRFSICEGVSLPCLSRIIF